ncbi:MAG TPA: Uma2 family endonuclease [Planctomycetaceae bacterium]
MTIVDAQPAAEAGGRLLTAEEYADLSLPYPSELVRGRVTALNQPRPRHGFVCANVFRLIDRHVSRYDLGYVFPNDTGFITRRGPDSVRGPDVCFYSYARLPKGRLPDGYPEVAPELAFEVISPSDRWRDVLEKVVEYLDAGVLAVCVLDPQRQTAHVNPAERAGNMLTRDDELSFPEILPGFSVRVSDLFTGAAVEGVE